MARMLELTRQGERWLCPDVAAKLAARAKLPGAFAFDRAAEGLRQARARDVDVRALLPLAFASSWLVNNAAPSPVFQKWLEAPAIDVWCELVAALEQWPSLAEDERSLVVGAARALTPSPHGAGAISKVLALLVPDVVPLMPDAALWFALGTPARPENPDAQTASVDALAPMLDWFTQERLRTQLERVDDLSPAQVLDRVLWFDSAGYRFFRAKSGAGWYWVIDGDRQGIVRLGTAPTTTSEPHDVASPGDEPWKDEARRALDG